MPGGLPMSCFRIACACLIVTALTAVAEEPPKSAKEYLERAKARADKREFDAAAADFTEAIRLDPKQAKAFYGRGYVHWDRGDFDKAIADFTEAIRLDSKDPDARAARGGCLERK